MSELPPIPPGFVLDKGPAAPRKRRDPWEILQEEGFTATNGFRTDGDTDRIRAQGYKPAENSLHKKGDAVDLDHPALSPAQQTKRLHELFGDWEGAFIDDEGHHRHMQLPGWGAAPGTPGTPNSGLPPIPAGFELQQRGPLTPNNFVVGAQPPPTTPTVAPLVKGANAGIAFADELPPEVRSKLRPEQVTQWHDLARNPTTKPEQLEALMGGFGFTLHNAADIVKARGEGLGVREDFEYRPNAPRDTETGRRGAVLRAAANALTGNFAAEIQATGRTARDWLDGTIPEGSSFGDQLGRNADYFEGAYAFDRERYPVTTFATELGAGALIPFGAAARTPAALAKVGAGYGAVYGAGDGSGGLIDRIPNAILGAGLGAGGGYALGKGIDLVSPHVGRGIEALRGRLGGTAARDSIIPPGVGREAAYEAAPLVQDGTQGAPGYRPGTAQGAVAASRDGRPSLPDTGIPATGEVVLPPIPEGYVLDDVPAGPVQNALRGGERSGGDNFAAMASDIDAPMLTGPAPRERDYIRLDDLPPLPEGYVLADDVPLGRTRPMGEQPTPEELAEVVRGMRPEDVTPIPGNTVQSLDEFERMGDPRPLLQAPDERAELSMRTLPSGRRRRGPLDLIEDIRAQPWGLVDEGGDLAAMGIGQRRDFAKGEGTLGRIIAKNGDEGRSLDMAAEWAWERGYFPHHSDRPTVNEFLDLLDDTNRGTHRAYRLDDLEEVERFKEAQASRFGIEQAADEGRPLADDIGQPIGPDDLRAMEPPAVAYEDLPAVGARIGNIDTSKLNTPHAIERAMKNLEARVGGFDAARRGKISHAETEALAGELGMTVDSLLKARKGRAFNAEEALAARTILAKSYDELVAMAQKAMAGASDEELASFHAAMLRTLAIHEKVTAATAEAGRALQAFKISADSKAIGGRIHESLVQGAGGRDRLEDVAKGIIELQKTGHGPGEVTKFATGALKPRWSDYFVEYYYNALLSGISTHVVNTVSNLATQLSQVPEFLIGAGVGATRRPFNKALAERVTFSEVGARAIGMVQGSKEGLHAFAKVMKTGDPTDPLTKIEARRHKVIPGLGGSIIRTPTRLLMAEDELFKATARRSSLAGLATRKAQMEGLKGEAVKHRIAELVADPTDDMLEQSFDYARYMTFQNPLGAVGQSLSRATEAAPVLKLVIPFIRTPVNLFKYSLERTPLVQFALKRVRDDYKAGGARRDMAIARATFGGGIGAMVAMYAAEGKITGRGPSDPSTRRLLMAGGWQPYSVKIGDTYYSYSRLDPFATMMGMAADLATYSEHLTEKQQGEAHVALIDSILSQIESKTWLSGMSDLVQALDDPSRFGESYVSRLAGSLVPTISAHVASSIDPVARQTVVNGDMGASIANRVRSRIPGLSQGLPEQRDAFGQPIRKDAGPIANLISPFYTRKDKNDPVTKAMLDAGVGMGRPQRSLSDGMGGERELNDQEFGQYQELAGRYIRDDVAAAVADPEWGQLDQDEQRKEIKAIVREARADARMDLFGDPEDWEDGAAPAALPAMPSNLPPLPPGFELAPR